MTGANGRIDGSAMLSAELKQVRRVLDQERRKSHVPGTILGYALSLSKTSEGEAATQGAWPVDALEAFDAGNLVALVPGKITDPPTAENPNPEPRNALVVKVTPRPPPEARPRLKVIRG